MALENPAAGSIEPKPALRLMPTMDAIAEGPIAPLLIDSEELSRLTSISTRTIKRMVAEQAIPGIVRPFGRAVRFDLAAVRDWVANGCPRPMAARFNARPGKSKRPMPRRGGNRRASG